MIFILKCLTPASLSELMADCLQRAWAVCLNLKVIRARMLQGSTEPQRDRERQMARVQGRATLASPVPYTCYRKLSMSSENNKSGSKLLSTCLNLRTSVLLLSSASKQPPFRLLTTQTKTGKLLEK